MSTFEPAIADSLTLDSLEWDLPVPPSKRMSEEDFVAWCGREIRAEWVEGEVLVMSPVSEEQADVQVWMSAVLSGYVGHLRLGKVYGPEFFVRFPSQSRRRLPDLLFVASEHSVRVKKSCVEGPPDMIVEIVGEESVVRDKQEKYLEYELAGVLEYWILDPQLQEAVAYVLGDDGKYRRIDEQRGWLASTVVAGFRINTSWLWERPLPSIVEVLAELGVFAAKRPI